MRAGKTQLCRLAQAKPGMRHGADLARQRYLAEPDRSIGQGAIRKGGNQRGGHGKVGSRVGQPISSGDVEVDFCAGEIEPAARFQHRQQHRKAAIVPPHHRAARGRARLQPHDQRLDFHQHGARALHRREHRAARQRRIATVGFFAACGTFFFRFCRLGLLAGVAYWIVFETVHTWLFENLYAVATENLVVEQTAFLIRIGLYATFALLLLPINMVFDYAKVRAVVEDRHSMAGAVLAAIRFIWRRPQATVGLYLLNSGLFLAVLAAYAILAPSPSGGAVSMWIGFAVGQAYVVARLFMKLVFYASQTSFSRVNSPIRSTSQHLLLYGQTRPRLKLSVPSRR